MNLAPVHRIVLAQVAEEAEQTVRAAQRTRGRRLAEARQHAAEMVASARQAGEAEARLEAARRTAAARRQARSHVLATRRELYEELCREALARAAQLRTAPTYSALLTRLERLARAELGADAVVEVDPGGAGGLIARCDGKIVDYSLPVLVERCIGALGARIGELWR